MSSTVTVTIGDVRGVGPLAGSRLSEPVLRRWARRIADTLDTVYMIAYDPAAGLWEGVSEGTLVIVGVTSDLPLLRDLLRDVALVLDQEAVGLVAQDGTDTLVWSRAAAGLAGVQ
jgi:hypothetical protein